MFSVYISDMDSEARLRALMNRLRHKHGAGQHKSWAETTKHIRTAMAVSSVRTSTQKLELSVVGASDPSARVKNLIVRKLRADNIFVLTHASDATLQFPPDFIK